MKRHFDQNDLMALIRRKELIQWAYPSEDNGPGIVKGMLFLYNLNSICHCIRFCYLWCKVFRKKLLWNMLPCESFITHLRLSFMSHWKKEILRALYQTKKLFLISKLPRVEGDWLKPSNCGQVPKNLAMVSKKCTFWKRYFGTSNQQNVIKYKT